MLNGIKDFLFAVRHGFRGFPVIIGDNHYRIDESLRRWNFAGENDVRICLEENLNSGDIGIDVGANFGMHTLVMANRVGSTGRVIAYEPVPRNVQLLQKNVCLNRFDDLVEIRETALSDISDEYVEMSVDLQGLDPAASLANSMSENDQSRIKVANHSLDKDFHDFNSNVNCLIKIDVEGAELSVLRGGAEFLKKVKPKLLIEVHDYALPAFGESTENVYAFLKGLGYEVQRLTDMNNHNGHYHHILAIRKG